MQVQRLKGVIISLLEASQSFYLPHPCNQLFLLQVVAILSRKGRCERASIDEVYLDLTDAAEKMLSETPPESLEVIDDEVIKSHVLGISAVRILQFHFSSCYRSLLNLMVLPYVNIFSVLNNIFARLQLLLSRPKFFL